jgi:hypothetical protein
VQHFSGKTISQMFTVYEVNKPRSFGKLTVTQVFIDVRHPYQDEMVSVVHRGFIQVCGFLALYLNEHTANNCSIL